MSYRIAPVDGLRAVAAVGVVWVHVWQAFGNVSWSLVRVGTHSINLNQPISVVGTGVDLFFVISGFCMYLMYARKQTAFSWASYGAFLRKRWLRIAPAYYAAAVAICLGYLIVGRAIPWWDLLTNITFTQHYLPHAHDLVAPFWSLTTEWGFYLVLPLCIALGWRWGFWRAMTLLAIVCVLFRLVAFEHFPLAAYSNVDWNWSCFVLFRLIEFVWGMCIARLFVLQTPPPRILTGTRGLATALIVTALGRAMMTHLVVHAGHTGAVLLATAGTPLLTLGYALILWNTIASNSPLRSILCTRPFQLVGRWSYSLYLWHAYPVAWISALIIAEAGRSAGTQYLAFGLVVAVLLPISALSFRLFEQPYFQWRAAKQPQASTVVERSAI